jgi:hypothetical protein
MTTFKAAILSGTDKGKIISVSPFTYDDYFNLSGNHELCYTDSFKLSGKISTGIIHVKINGKIKTWKRQPGKFQLPVKYGLYEYSYITAENYQITSNIYLCKITGENND